METSYEHRNLAVCNAIGICAGLDKVYRRMSARKDCPQWIKDDLADLILRAQKSKISLIDYREMSPRNTRTPEAL